MKKRIALLLSLVMVISTIMPVTTFADAPVTTVSDYDSLQAAVNSATDGVEKIIQLGANILSMTNCLEIPSAKVIVLNLGDHRLDRGLGGGDAKADGSVIKVKNGATLILKGSVEDGIITGGNTTGEGGGINVSSQGKLIMEGCRIIGNSSQKSGSGIALSTSTKFYMKGGAVTDNTSYDSSSGASGAGVYFSGPVGQDFSGKMFVGGDAIIQDNVKVNAEVETAANLYLTQKLTIGTGDSDVDVPATKTGMKIGILGALLPVTEGTQMQFTTESAKSGDEQYFIPDDPKFKLSYNNLGYLEMKWPQLYVTADKESYNIGDDINLTIHTKFVPDGTVVTISDGIDNQWTSTVSEATASFSVKAEKAGNFTYTASIVDPALKAEKKVTVSGGQSKTFTVRFNTNGGTPIPETQSVVENGKVTKPLTDPEKDGYEFVDWYADSTLNTPYNFDTAVTQDITLYAKWVGDLSSPHRIYVDVQGEGEASADLATASNGDLVNLYATPSNGYEFKTWKIEGECSAFDPTKANTSFEMGTTMVTATAVFEKKSSGSSSSRSSKTFYTGNWGRPVTNGTWKQNADGTWTYTTSRMFKNTWGYIYNPYAAAGQHTSDWFYFDANGNMLTGWQQLYWNGKLSWFYFNQVHEGTYGACQLGGITPDGYTLNADGSWAGF